MFEFLKRNKKVEEVVEDTPYSLQVDILQRFADVINANPDKPVMAAIYDALGERSDRTLSGLTDEEVLEKLKNNI
jgi:hypothetical protein